MNLLTFFKDGDGNFSATRLAFLAWSIGVLAVWMGNNIQVNRDFKIDKEVVYILGILMTGKVTQAFAENQSDTDGAKKPTGTGASTPQQTITGEFQLTDGKKVSLVNGIVTKVT